MFEIDLGVSVFLQFDWLIFVSQKIKREECEHKGCSQFKAVNFREVSLYYINKVNESQKNQ
jgi:hypothetical protein